MTSDCVAVLRGLQKLGRAVLLVHGQNAQEAWKSSYCLQQFVSSRCPCRLTSARGEEGLSQSPHPINRPSAEDIGLNIADHVAKVTDQFASTLQTPPETPEPDVVTSREAPIATHDKHRERMSSSVEEQESLAGIRTNDQALQAVPSLASRARQRRVPASRVGRLMSFTSLAAGMGVGAVAEFSKRTLGFSTGTTGSSHFLTEANINRLVSTLCRVRGAALKLGQMISIQDGQFISPQIQEIFERVRDGADYMPPRQCEKAIAAELGPDWRDHLESFEEMPLAAASIGQVHKAVMKDGRHVVMKVQYPGVAESIDSDINNILTLMSSTKILPEGLFAENALRVARKELSWEVDYEREAECTTRFAQLLDGHSFFVVPKVISELSAKRVLTTEFLQGTALDRYNHLTQEQRNTVGHYMLELCFREVFEFRFMQTDPNWSNFFYLPKENKVGLLDFGASRDFPKSFVDQYLRVIYAASQGDRQGVLDGSLKMGFLTGFETDVMMQAHTDAVMVLGEPFLSNSPFDFGEQHVSGRIRKLMPVMLEHRLTPPPEETYSLHRKLSGCFLLCAKLQASITCKPILEKIMDEYRFG